MKFVGTATHWTLTIGLQGHHCDRRGGLPPLWVGGRGAPPLLSPALGCGKPRPPPPLLMY